MWNVQKCNLFWSFLFFKSSKILESSLIIIMSNNASADAFCYSFYFFILNNGKKFCKKNRIKTWKNVLNKNVKLCVLNKKNNNNKKRINYYFLDGDRKVALRILQTKKVLTNIIKSIGGLWFLIIFLIIFIIIKNF